MKVKARVLLVHHEELEVEANGYSDALNKLWAMDFGEYSLEAVVSVASGEDNV